MLCKLQDFKKWCLRAALVPTLFLTMSLIVWAPMAMAQAQLPTDEQAGGKISGAVPEFPQNCAKRAEQLHGFCTGAEDSRQSAERVHQGIGELGKERFRRKR